MSLETIRNGIDTLTNRSVPNGILTLGPPFQPLFTNGSVLSRALTLRPPQPRPRPPDRAGQCRLCASPPKCLSTLAQLEHVTLKNLLVGRLVGRVVHADGRPDCEVRRVHLAIVIGEGARPREELLAVALMRDVRGRLLEHNVVKRERVLRTWYMRANSLTIPSLGRGTRQ